MSDDTGMLRTDVELESHTRRGERGLLRQVLVDTGAELSWVQAEVLESLGIERVKRVRFQQADGSVLERSGSRSFIRRGPSPLTRSSSASLRISYCWEPAPSKA